MFEETPNQRNTSAENAGTGTDTKPWGENQLEIIDLASSFFKGDYRSDEADEAADRVLNSNLRTVPKFDWMR